MSALVAINCWWKLKEQRNLADDPASLSCSTNLKKNCSKMYRRKKTHTHTTASVLTCKINEKKKKSNQPFFKRFLKNRWGRSWSRTLHQEKSARRTVTSRAESRRRCLLMLRGVRVHAAPYAAGTRQPPDLHTSWGPMSRSLCLAVNKRK